MPPLGGRVPSQHRFCLLAGVEALAGMLEEDATTVCGADQWGVDTYRDGGVKVARPQPGGQRGELGELAGVLRVRLLEWALNLMVVSTRGPSARGRPGESDAEVASALCGAVAEVGSPRTSRSSTCWRRSACRRPCLGGGDRRRWQRRQACPGRGRGGDGEHCRRSTISSPGGSIRRCPGCSSSMARRRSDPQHLRCGRRHPALPGPQGP